MIRFNNWNIEHDGEVIARQFDNKTRSFTVTGDIPADWEWDLLVSVEDNLDIIPLTATEGALSVVLTAEQVSIAGFYRMQLRATQGDLVRHTNKLEGIYIPPSLSGDKQWPVLPTTFSELERRVKGYADHPPVVSYEGYWQLWDGEQYADSNVPATGGIQSVTYNAETWRWEVLYMDGRVDTFPGPSPLEGGKATYLRDDFERCPVGQDAFYGNERYLFEERYHVHENGVRFADYDVVESGGDRLLKLTCTNDDVNNAKLYNKMYMAAPVVGGCTMEVEFKMERPDGWSQASKRRPGIHLDLFGKQWFGGVETDNRIIRLAIRAGEYVRITDTATTGAAINTYIPGTDSKWFAPKYDTWYVVRHSCERGRVSVSMWERDTSGEEQAYTLEYRTDAISDAVMEEPRCVSLQTCNGSSDSVVDIPYTVYVSELKVWHDLTGPAGKDGTDGKNGTNGKNGTDGVGVSDWRYNPDTWRWEMHYTNGQVDTFPGMSLTERGKFTVHRDNFEGYPVGQDTFWNNDRYKFSSSSHGDPNSDSFAVYNVVKDGDGQVLELVCENATTHYLRTVHTVSGPYALSMDFLLDTTVAGSRPGFILYFAAEGALNGKVVFVLRTGDYARVRDSSSGSTVDTYILNADGSRWKPVEGVWYHVEARLEPGRVVVKIWERDDAAAPIRSLTANSAAIDEAALSYPKTQTLTTYAPGSQSQPVVGGRHTMRVDELRIWQELACELTEADKAEIVSRVLAELK